MIIYNSVVGSLRCSQKVMMCAFTSFLERVVFQWGRKGAGRAGGCRGDNVPAALDTPVT